MSWQDYVDKQLIGSGSVTSACIAGMDGNVWAKSPGYEVKVEEVLAILKGLDDPTQFQMHGVHVAGERYFYLSGSDKILRAKMQKCGLHCVKTTQALIIATYKEPIQPQQAASTVEVLGDYLVKCGY